MGLRLTYTQWASLVAQLVKNLPTMQETLVQFLDQEDPLEKDRLPTPAFLGFPGGSDGKSACNAGDLALVSGLGRSPEEGWQPTPIFLPEESHEQRSLAGSMGVHGVAKSQTQLSNIHFHFTFYILYLLSKE